MKRALLKDAPKTMAVLDPVAARIVILRNKDIMKDSSIKVQEKVVLDRNDVKMLAVNQQVILKTAGVFKVVRAGDALEL